jgi:NAD-dependent dihydropyrimidine dehydrogenase PreA subunit
MDIYMLPNPSTPGKAISFNPDLCTGCNRCVEICRNDVLMPNPKKGNPPIVLYADECYYCGGCVEECPRPGAISMTHPLRQSIIVNWKRKNTCERYNLLKNTLPPNTKPPSGRKGKIKMADKSQSDIRHTLSDK